VSSVATISAHDLWIEPTSYRPEPGKVVGVRLRVGQDFMGDPIARDPALIDQFVIVGPDRAQPVPGMDGADPAGLIRPSGPGLSIVTYRSRPAAITLPAEKFTPYLKDEGLDAVARLRVARHQEQAPAREEFIRCAKSLVQVAPARPADRDRVTGMTLELVAQENPYLLRPGDELHVQLRYEGRPLAGALVVALNRATPGARVSVRADANGLVTIPLAAPGPWLVKAVQMIEAPAGSGAEWRSYWASLTFELAAAASGTR
jgi:hypothetical protein